MGTEPVRDWLKNLPTQSRKLIGQDIQTVQRGWPMGMPLVKSLGDGLWEIRSYLPEGTARVIFFVQNEKLVVLHGFIKKSQKLPISDLELAKKRKKLFLSDT